MTDPRISTRLFHAIQDELRARARLLGYDLEAAPCGAVLISVADLEDLVLSVGCCAAIKWQELVREHGES